MFAVIFSVIFCFDSIPNKVSSEINIRQGEDDCKVEGDQYWKLTKKLHFFPDVNTLLLSVSDCLKFLQFGFIQHRGIRARGHAC